MLSGIIFTVVLCSPMQADPVPIPNPVPKPAQEQAPVPAPAPRQLPPVEGLRSPGELPKPSEVALPPAASTCASCSPSSNLASYPPGCSGGSCNGTVCLTQTMGPPNVAWSDQQFLYYTLKDAPLPNLLTGVGGVPLIDRGARFGRAVGAMVSGGSWFDDAHTLGYGFSVFLLEQRSSQNLYTSDANGNPLMARPFIDASSGDPARFFVSNPGQTQGSIAIESGARLAGAEYYGLKNVYYSNSCCFNVLAGIRYQDLDEYMQIFQKTSAATGAAPGFTVANTATNGPIDFVDRFRTRNQFYGFEVGARGDYTHGCMSFGVTTKIAIGNNHQTLDIAGQTKAPGAPTTSGGLLALSTNIGYTRMNRMAMMADVSPEVGIQITKGSKIFAACDFIYLNEVIRPGVMVDSVINTRFVPASPNFGTLSGPNSPLRTQNRTDFFSYGMRFGYQVQY